MMLALSEQKNHFFSCYHLQRPTELKKVSYRITKDSEFIRGGKDKNHPINSMKRKCNLLTYLNETPKCTMTRDW